MPETIIKSIQPKINDAITIANTSINNIDITNGNAIIWDQYTGIIIQNTGTTVLDIEISSNLTNSGRIKKISMNAIPIQGFVFINFLDMGFCNNGLVKIAYNKLTGTSTNGKIIPISYNRP